MALLKRCGDKPGNGLTTMQVSEESRRRRPSVIALARIGQHRYVFRPVNELVQMAKAFADPTRVRILAALRAQELCVCELCDVLGIGQSTLSTHLQVIRESGLVTTRKEGKWVYYSSAADKKSLIDAVFAFFSRGVARDQAISQDAIRLEKRMEEREGGSCCRGFEPARNGSRLKRAKVNQRRIP